MNIICTSFDNMTKRINEHNSRVVFFGSGVLGQITAPQVFEQYGIIDRIDYYIDNDRTKWGDKICISGKQVPVYGSDILENHDNNTVIILNISRFSGVLKQLEAMECTKNMDCYIMGMMCIHNFCAGESRGKIVFNEKELIPRKIHYMWLGRKALPDNLKKCIDSWKRYCPDYEIFEWNEDNYDIDKHPYMRQAYDAGAYGFVPDFARIDILYEQGGIYMDTDVELRKKLDPLLHQEAFCGVEKWQVINFGGCSGSVKGNKIIKRFLDARKDIYFIDKEGKQNRNTCGFYDTRVAMDLGYKLDGTTQSFEGLNIYASDYFQPYDYMSGNLSITEHTYSIHWFNGGWLDEENKEANRRTSQEYNDLYNSCKVEG